MAKFLSNGTPDVDITIIKDTEVDRKSLINLKNHEKLGDGVDLIYMYSLENEQINYPKQDGNILYIGEAGRQKKLARGLLSTSVQKLLLAATREPTTPCHITIGPERKFA